MDIAKDAFTNMKGFMEACSFKKAILIYLAFKLPEMDIEELRKLFIQVDKNGDGRINKEEFKTAISAFGFKFN